MDSIGLRNLKDFLLQYNKITESCFLNCVNHLSDRFLSQNESGCVDMCAKKYISVNHKIMQVYMEIQPLLINKRIEEMNKQQAALDEAQKKEEEANQSAGVAAAVEKEKAKDAKKLMNIAPEGDRLTEKDVIRTELH